MICCLNECKTCDEAEKCLSCKDDINRTLNTGTGRCDCSEKFFDDGNLVCAECYYACKTCSKLAECDLCVDSWNTDFRKNEPVNKCPCVSGRYDQKTLNPAHTSTMCVLCDPTCKECVGD